MRKTKTLFIAEYQKKPVKRSLGFFLPTKEFERPSIYYGSKKEKIELYSLPNYFDAVAKNAVSDLVLWGTTALFFAEDYHPALAPLVANRFYVPNYFDNIVFYKRATDAKLKIKSGNDVEQEVNYFFKFLWRTISMDPLDPQLSGTALSDFVLQNIEWFFTENKRVDFFNVAKTVMADLRMEDS